MRNAIRVLIACALLACLATPAAAAAVDPGPTMTARVLELVDGWLEKLGIAGDSKNGDEGGAPTDGEDEEPPTFDGAGAEYDPNG